VWGRRFRWLWVAGAAGLLWTGCAGESPRVRMDPRDQLDRCRRQVEHRKFDKAILELQDLVLNYPGTPEGMQGQYLLGEAYRKSEQYDLAREAYQHLIRDYPDSDLRDDAQLMIGIAYLAESPPAEYDQELTYKAIEEFEVFLADYPTSELRGQAESRLAECNDKLARKEFLNGQLYLKMGHTEAARRVFEHVLAGYPASSYAAPSLLGIARSYLRDKNREQAQSYVDRLIREHPESPEAREAERSLPRGAGVPEEGT
jgi:outer membrane protein assembly factor BamD